jgi:hypothetical protein
VVAVTDLSRHRIVPVPKKGGSEPTPREKPGRGLGPAKAKAVPVSPTLEPPSTPIAPTELVGSPSLAPALDQLSMDALLVTDRSEDRGIVGTRAEGNVALTSIDHALLLCPECHNQDPDDCTRCGGDGWVALAA